MPQVVLVGMGLDSEKGITIEGLEEARRADKVFAEFYTNPMPNLDLRSLEEMIGKKIIVLDRAQLEEDNAEEILRSSEKEKVAFLVPGDPMIATTHVSLRLELAKKGISSRIVHGASVGSAICGATGLQSFKFGKSVTLPQADEPVPGSVLNTIQENRVRGLHTLLLFDVKSGEVTQMTIASALRRLTEANPSVSEWLAVGVARIGSRDEKARAAKAKILEKL